eukprot:1675699-Rhodomonas_salina.2
MVPRGAGGESEGGGAEAEDEWTRSRMLATATGTSSRVGALASMSESVTWIGSDLPDAAVSTRDIAFGDR